MGPLPLISSVHKSEAKAVEIEDAKFISSVAFLADGKHFIGGGYEGTIRCWRVEDGQEVGDPMNAGHAILSLAASQDGKWVVSGTEGGRVTVWDAVIHSKVREFEGHANFPVETVDVSPDGTRIATGAHDMTACVWSLFTGERLIGPLRHDSTLAVVKYSLDGFSLATAACDMHSVRIYDSRDGRLITNIPVKVDTLNQSLSWSSNNKYLFALAEGKIKCLDVFSGVTLSQWSIHSDTDPRGIVLASNGKFVAAVANSSVSFWDITTHDQIGPVIEPADILFSMAVSPSYDFVTSGVKSVVLRRLDDILPPHYCDNISSEWLDSPMENVNSEETIESLLADIRHLRAQHESSQEKIAKLENAVQEFRSELAESRRVANQEKNDLYMTIESLRARDESSDRKIARLEALVRSNRSRSLHAGLRYPPQRPFRA